MKRPLGLQLLRLAAVMGVLLIGAAGGVAAQQWIMATCFKPPIAQIRTRVPQLTATCDQTPWKTLLADSALPEEKIHLARTYCETLSHKLGPFKQLGNITSQTQSRWTRDGLEVRAIYYIQALYGNGRYLIELVMTKDDPDWKVSEYAVHTFVR